ncbi:MAG: amidohydrolase [Ensifer adhaerens]
MKTSIGKTAGATALAFLTTYAVAPTLAADGSTVIRNAAIHTMASDEVEADAIAIDAKGVIVAVGKEADVMSKAEPDARVIDLGGKAVLPGFQDTHVHLVEAGVNEILCEFEPFATLKQTRQTIEACDVETEGEWVLGSGVSMPHLLDQTDDPVAVLDELVPDRPALILDDIGHGAWANSKALQAAGYDAIKGNPPGGIILRHSANGRPNGIVLENAQQKLRNLAFPDTPENEDFVYQSMLPTLKTFAENGITTVSDAGGFWPQGHIKAWETAERNGTLTVRASNALYVYPDLPFDEQVQALAKLYSNDPDRLLKFNQAKLYVDGILEQRTGAVLQPYLKGPGIDHGFNSGFLYFQTPVLNDYARALSEIGFKLHFHVTGDRGARLALDAIDQADRKAGPHRLTHLYLLDRADYARFRETDTVADFQLAPSSLDPDYIAFISKFIGARADHMMPAASLEKDGATVVISSDFDADELSPLVKIQAALERPREGAADVRTAVKWMTVNPARLLNQDDRTGTLEVGKYADLVVLDRDIFDIPVNEIGETNVKATFLQGKPVFDADELFASH